MFNAWPAHASKSRAQRGLVRGATWEGDISFSPLRPQGPGKSPCDRSESQRKAAGPFYLHAERSSEEGCKEGSPRAGRRRGAHPPAAQHPCCRPCVLSRGGRRYGQGGGQEVRPHPQAPQGCSGWLPGGAAPALPSAGKGVQPPWAGFGAYFTCLFSDYWACGRAGKTGLAPAQGRQSHGGFTST